MDTFNAILVFAYATGLFLLLVGLLGRAPAPKLGRLSLMPILAAAILFVYMALTFGATPLSLSLWAVSTPIRFAVAGGATLLAASLTYSLGAWLSRGTAIPSIWPPALVLVLILGIQAQLRARTVSAVRSSVDGLVQATFPLPGGPTDVVFLDESSGYIALDHDFFTPSETSVIHRFSIPRNPGDSLTLEAVATDLSYVRGLAILDGTLYASDQGELPCPDVALVDCIPGLDPERGEPAVLPVTRGRVLAFPIADDGSLGDRSVVLDDLPVVNSEHSLQDIEVGPDGRLYLSIGGPGQLARRPELIEAMERPNKDLLGTVVSFNPDGSDVRVYARGFRNVFQLAFDETGNLFGAENDGPGAREWKFEEVLQIKPGADYGFPYEGTFGPGERRTDDPLWIQNTVGSAGLEWAGKLGLAPGLLLGSEKRVALLALTRDDRGYHVRNRSDITDLITLPEGNVTVLEASPESGQLVAGVYALESKLILMDFEAIASGAMLALTCAGCHGTDFRGMAGLGPDLTPAGNMGDWTVDDFVTALTTGVRPDGTTLDAQRMPWLQFAELPEEDLATLWNYLRSSVVRADP